jgi:hypothetical protein
MKYTATLLIAGPLLLAAPVTAQERATGHALVVIDLRPPEERQGTGLAPLSGDCNVDVYRVGDAASSPLKVAALKSELAVRLGAAGRDKTLTVLNWTIYYNKQLYGGQPWGKIVPGGLGFPMPGIPGKGQGSFPGSKCSRPESAGGWFERSEVTGKHSPLISVFEGTFAGNSVGVRIVHSPQRRLGEFKGDADDSRAVLDAVHETVVALVAILPL